MNEYIIRRLLQAIPVLLGITLVTFAVTELAPGDAVSAMILARGMEDLDLADIDMDALRHQYGLDKPAPYRYLMWLKSILQGDMGTRIRAETPVSEAIFRHVPATLQLMGVSLIISFLIGVPIGIICALKQYSWFDYVSTTLVFAGISTPGFFVAIVAIYVFALHLRLFPTSGYSSMREGLSFFETALDRLRYLALPAGVLSITGLASYVRYTRVSMLEVMRSDYVAVARSKGLRERAVVLRHMFRNALLPLITIIGLRLPRLFGGTLIIETIFNWPGMGILYMDGVMSRDYPLIMSMVLISALVIVASNLLADLAYGMADPRIRYD